MQKEQVEDTLKDNTYLLIFYRRSRRRIFDLFPKK